MAAVVDRVDGCVGSFDSDSVSPRQSSPPPDHPHQNNPLLGLPIVAIETVLHFLSYDEISLLRSVRTKQDEANASLMHLSSDVRHGLSADTAAVVQFCVAVSRCSV